MRLKWGRLCWLVRKCLHRQQELLRGGKQNSLWIPGVKGRAPIFYIASDFNCKCIGKICILGRGQRLQYVDAFPMYYLICFYFKECRFYLLLSLEFQSQGIPNICDFSHSSRETDNMGIMQAYKASQLHPTTLFMKSALEGLCWYSFRSLSLGKLSFNCL